MHLVLTALALLIAILSGLVGLLWLVAPKRAAARYPIDDPQGATLSTLVGMSSSWCLAISVSVLAGLYFREPIWFYPPAMLFGIVAIGRLAAALFHGAPVLLRRVAGELILAGVTIGAGLTVS